MPAKGFRYPPGLHSTGKHLAHQTAAAPARCRRLMAIETCLECKLDDCRENEGLELAVRKLKEGMV